MTGWTAGAPTVSAQVAIQAHRPTVALAPPAGLPARACLNAPARGEWRRARQSPLARRATRTALMPGARMPSEDDFGGASRATGRVSCPYLHAVKPQLVRHERENCAGAKRIGRPGGGEVRCSAFAPLWLARGHAPSPPPTPCSRCIACHGAHGACSCEYGYSSGRDCSGVGTGLRTQHDRAQLEIVRLEMRQKLR